MTSTNNGQRCRFAPSPTGYLHVGSARTALFNWLFARATGGTFVLRVEDTDSERNRPELIEAIFDELHWLGIDWDEGPYYQSERRERHQSVVSSLVAQGRAYLVDSDNTPIDSVEMLDGHAVRYSCPAGRTVRFQDAVRGDVQFSTDDLEDFVIWRSNGSPTFLLANAVDDADMGITHAIRGEDLLSTTPKVQLLLDELGAEPPVYAHLPLLVNERRKKLSKRRDDVSIADYRARGYLPEAMVNYLALLGWGPDDDIEIRPLDEIIAKFNLGSVSKSPAFFDGAKLDHFNATYIQALSVDEYVALVLPSLREDPRWPADAVDESVVRRFAGEVQQRVSTIAASGDWYEWLFAEVAIFDEKAFTKSLVNSDKGLAVIDGVAEAFTDCDWEAETLARVVRRVGDDLDVRSAVPVRVAITGRSSGIPLYEPLQMMGREYALERLGVARERVEASR